MEETKKVVLIIVEGSSDEMALEGIFNFGLANSKVVYVIMHCDITSEIGINSNNIIKNLYARIKEQLERYKYKKTDILRIVHIVDLDGTFINEDAIKIKNIKNFEYHEDCIYANSKDRVISRNRQKTNLLGKLRQTGKINGMLYRVYYNSCNLEHVLYNELQDFTSEEKINMASDFSDLYEGKEEEFIKKLGSSELKPCDTYKECWEYAEKDNNSLKRHSNMYFIFEED